MPCPRRAGSVIRLISACPFSHCKLVSATQPTSSPGGHPGGSRHTARAPPSTDAGCPAAGRTDLAVEVGLHQLRQHERRAQARQVLVAPHPNPLAIVSGERGEDGGHQSLLDNALWFPPMGGDTLPSIQRLARLGLGEPKGVQVRRAGHKHPSQRRSIRNTHDSSRHGSATMR